MTAGMLCGTVGLLVLTRIEADSPYGLLLVGYLLFGIALGLVYAPMSTAAMAAMPREKVGIASGVLAMDRVLAGAVALAATGAAFHALLGDGHSFAAAVAGSTWVAVVLCALGTVLTWAFVRDPPEPIRHPASAPSTTCTIGASIFRPRLTKPYPTCPLGIERDRIPEPFLPSS